MNESTNSIGKLGESIASTHLIKRGFKILHRNYRFGKKEIDIIAEYQDIIVFVEVKTRDTDFFGRPEEFLSKRQQKHIISAANHYIIENDIPKESRFDVIAIVLGKNKENEITHIEDAFYPTL